MINSISIKGVASIAITTFFLLFFSSCSKAQINYWEYAKANIKKYNPPRKDLAVVIDYSKSIWAERLYVIEVTSGSIILSSTVAHAWRSGSNYAVSFSNTINSKMSSKGNYITGSTIISPRFGPAMLVKGLDRGVNDNAKTREIIFHSTKKMKTKWSEGCFATPEEKNQKIIELTKNGVLVCVIV